MAEQKGCWTAGGEHEVSSGAGPGEMLQKQALVEPLVEEADDHAKHGEAEEGCQEAHSGHTAGALAHEEIN